MKRKHYAILVAQGLSYALIITFIFADTQYNFSGILRGDTIAISLKSAHVAASLIGIVGATSLWLTWQYIAKANSMGDLLVICAWTHRVKTDEGWVSMEKFFTDQLGFAVSHGISESKFKEMRDEMENSLVSIKSRPHRLDPNKPIIGLPPSTPCDET